MKILNLTQPLLQLSGFLLIMLYPLITPLIGHGTTTLFAVLFLIGLISLGISLSNSDAPLKKLPKWIYPVLLTYPSAIIVQNIYFQHWDGEGFDAASHFLLGIIVIPFICSMPAQRLKWISTSMALASIITLGYLLTHQNLVLERSATEFMGPTRLPHYITIFAILSVPLLRLDTLGKSLGILGLISAAVIVMFSQTRGAWLGALLVTVLFIYYQFNQSSKKLISAIVLLGLVITSVAFLTPSIKDRISFTFNEKSHKAEERSIMPRLEIWKMTIEIIREHSLLGVGRNHFVEARDQLIEAKKYPEYLNLLPHPHNELLYAWVETGLLGLIGMLLFYLLPGYFFWQNWRQNQTSSKLIAFCGLNVIFYYFFAGLTDIVIIASNLKASLYVLNIGVLISLIENQKAISKA